MNDARDLIEAIRGGVPECCDWCGLGTKPENLEPEEGGQWVCWVCIAAWEAKTNRHWHNGQPKTREEK